MELLQELRAKIRCYVDGEITLLDLREWLADHAQEIADSHDTELNDLDGAVWVTIAEYDYGHRTEEDVRRQLSAALLHLPRRPDRHVESRRT